MRYGLQTGGNWSLRISPQSDSPHPQTHPCPSAPVPPPRLPLPPALRARALRGESGPWDSVTGHSCLSRTEGTQDFNAATRTVGHQAGGRSHPGTVAGHGRSGWDSDNGAWTSLTAPCSPVPLPGQGAGGGLWGHPAPVSMEPAGPASRREEPIGSHQHDPGTAPRFTASTSPHTSSTSFPPGAEMPAP